MDYKTRNPGPVTWSDDPFRSTTSPEPHNQPYPGWLEEIRCDQDETFFLMHQSSFDESTGIAHKLLIEASHSCPMRKAFEWGAISWLDYWSHKGWLLHLERPFDGGSTRGRYITPHEVDDFSRKLWTKYGNKGPYLLKEEQLRLGWEYARPGTQDARDAEREYTAFMMRHGHRFAKKAA